MEIFQGVGTLAREGIHLNLDRPVNIIVGIRWEDKPASDRMLCAPRLSTCSKHKEAEKPLRDDLSTVTIEQENGTR
jgi:hypothetical protein